MKKGENSKKVYVVGHKNPDTDSICSAIAYASLKTKLTGIEHTPRRAGQLNDCLLYTSYYNIYHNTHSILYCIS